MAGKDAAEGKDGAAEGGGKKKLIMMVVPVLVLVGAGWFFFLRGGEAAAEELPAPVAGEMLELEPITINLAGGHYLKVGLALQAIEGGHSEPNGSKALDVAISLFSGKTIAELSSTAGRVKAKEELTARIKLAYLPHTEEEEPAAGESASTSDEEEASHDEESSEEESSHDEESADEEEASEEEHADSAGGHDYASLTAAEAIEAASHLTVQPEIYEVYFTEFVMQ